MQTFDGGYDWRPLTWIVFKIATVCCALITAVVLFAFGAGFLRSFCLFLSLEGTLMWAFSLSPYGGEPPRGNLPRRILWFFQVARGYTLAVNPRWLYAGIFCIFLSEILKTLFL
ncbi:MAG TPA: hypothetical protein VL404_08490 [Candidatus Eisenbacteria bacterium]|jgi:hypothetical protein|nr:hypothetical protein [Candidatus Eisenbacteria bacterium]